MAILPNEWWKGADPAGLQAGATPIEQLRFSQDMFKETPGYWSEVGDSGTPSWNDPSWWWSGVGPTPGQGSSMIGMDPTTQTLQMILKSGEKQGNIYDLLKGEDGLYAPTFRGTQEMDTNSGDLNKGLLAGLAMLAGGAGAFGNFGGLGAAAGGATEPVASLALGAPGGGGLGTLGSGTFGLSSLQAPSLMEGLATGMAGTAPVTGTLPSLTMPTLGQIGAGAVGAGSVIPTLQQVMDTTKVLGNVADVAKGVTQPPATQTPTGGGGYSDLLSLLAKGGSAYFGNKEQEKYGEGLMKMYQDAINRAAPYEERLRKSYEDPSSVFTSPEFTSGRDLYKTALDRKAAQTGTLSNPIARQQLLDKYGATYMNDYRRTLGDTTRAMYGDAAQYRQLQQLGLANTNNESAGYAKIIGDLFGSDKDGNVNWGNVLKQADSAIGAGKNLWDFVTGIFND